jgi:ubiquinone/menaquinone biosynthesis C-methylase UbiE
MNSKNFPKEIAVSEKHTYNHFSKIASKYRKLRTTDSEPILFIKNRLNGKSKINIADVGCGDGRYSLKLLQSLDDGCFLHCVDSNDDMLKHLEEYISETQMTNFCVRLGDANRLPLETDSVDCILTFNAIHHFDIEKFFEEVTRTLKEDGLFFIYTRLRNQNSRNIWGKYFPLFVEMENRLYDFDKLKKHIQQADMRIHQKKIFGYERTSSLPKLLEKARENHYSTFSLYSNDTFEESIETFEQNIRNNFDDLENIKWQDENILIEIEK